MRTMFRLVLAATLAAAPGLYAATDTATSTLAVTVAAEASITVNSSPTLTAAGTEFSNYTGNTTFTYLIRTSQGEGGGSITAQVTGNFSGAGAPDGGTHLSYTCGGAESGTACDGTVNASTSSATSVRTFGADAHSADSGDPGTISWILQNKPSFKTGNYSATVTLTISAT